MFRSHHITLDHIIGTTKPAPASRYETKYIQCVQMGWMDGILFFDVISHRSSFITLCLIPRTIYKVNNELIHILYGRRNDARLTYAVNLECHTRAFSRYFKSAGQVVSVCGYLL